MLRSESYPVLFPKSGTTRTRLNAWMEPVEDEIQTSMELDSTEMMKRFVMAGLGVSFLAASNCQEEDSGRLAAVSLAPEPMVRQLGLIYRKDKSLSKAALGFIQVTIDHAGAGKRTAGLCRLLSRKRSDKHSWERQRTRLRPYLCRRAKRRRLGSSVPWKRYPQISGINCTRIFRVRTHER